MAETSYSGTLRDVQTRLGNFLTPAVRLGVTGLSRSGKTVFITALVRNLIVGGRLPFFAADAEGRIVRAYLEPQPDDAVPRFDYEQHLDALVSPQPRWPDSTRRISELRLTIEYRSDNAIKRALGLSKTHIDIVDYPGEWLIDLTLLSKSFQQFSAEHLALSHDPARATAAKAFRDFLAGTDPAGPADEQIALAGTRLFTAYLAAARADSRQATLPPGRFLMPGDLEGSPVLTFFPMPVAEGSALPAGSLGAMLARRFESYKANVVQPFFRDHFARLDRQIVLVDVLGAIDKGADAVADLERAMTGLLQAFRPGANSWLSLLFGRRIDRVLFAATKADHLPATSHARLEAITTKLVEAARVRAEAEGAGVATLAMAALRATREGEVVQAGERLPCLIGTPLAGERIEETTYDGVTEAAIFPGDLPENADAALDKARRASAGSLALVRFRPPLIARQPGGPTAGIALPHVRLDRALQFLIGDYLS